MSPDPALMLYRGEPFDLFPGERGDQFESDRPVCIEAAYDVQIAAEAFGLVDIVYLVLKRQGVELILKLFCADLILMSFVCVSAV